MGYSTLIDATTLATHIDDPGWAVFDCRHRLDDPAAGSRNYLLEHLPGAVHANLETDLSGLGERTQGRHPLPDPAVLCERLGLWGVSPKTQVVAYDDAGGAFAARLWWLLRWLGHERVAVLNGGIDAWTAERRPLSVTIPSPVPATYPAFRPRAMTIDADTIAAGLASATLTLLDARAESRYRGEEEPIDPVAGHVPGAINLPFTGNLSGSGRFLPARQLERRYRTALGSRSPSSVAVMCGSGVTACHNLLAMEHAGLTGARLYPGSWSGWCSDPARPVATH